MRDGGIDFCSTPSAVFYGQVVEAYSAGGDSDRIRDGIDHIGVIDSDLSIIKTQKSTDTRGF